MGTPKLVIWDLDETILEGVFEEGDREVVPLAVRVIQELDQRGVLQGLATQNPPQVIDELRVGYEWFDSFVFAEASLGPKAHKVRRCLEQLDVHESGVAFVDEDPFERDSIAAQIPGIEGLSIQALADRLSGDCTVTEESAKRPRMYKAERNRNSDAQGIDYEGFLRGCDIRVTIRDCEPEDLDRVEELLTRTHRMNLGVGSVAETLGRIGKRGIDTIVAEIADRYGDMGRCGVIQLGTGESDSRVIESLAISCRTRARGLSLAMLAALLKHRVVPNGDFSCRYLATDRNRPLRMLLLAAGFEPRPESDQLSLSAVRLAKLAAPDWITVEHERASTREVS